MKKTILALLSVVMLSVSFGAHAATQATVALGGFSQVLTYTPTSKSPLGGRSLLIILHGCAQAYSAFAGAKLADAADANGMVIAVPDAVNKAGMACWDYWGLPPSRTLNDYARLINLAAALKQNAALEIDPNQVYIAGLSSGGAFAMEAGCLAPDVFAGMGLVGAPSAGTGMGGAFGFEGTIESTRAACLSYAGTNASHFNTQVTVSAFGTGDYTVSQNYGPQNAGAMARIYGHSDPSVSMTVTKATALINQEKTVLLMSLTGEGHAWPGGAGASGSFIGSASLNYATFLGDFFNKNNRRVTDPNNPPNVSVTASAAGVSILVNGTASDSDGTVASATIELKNTKNGTVKGPLALTVSSGQFSYNGFTNLTNATYEVTVKVTDNKGGVGTGTATVQITAAPDTFCPSTTGLRDSFSTALVTKATSLFTTSYTTTGDAQALSSGTQQYTIYTGSNGKGYLTDPEDCAVVVEEFTVTATAGTGGQVAPTTQKVQKGKSATVTVTPNSGYTIASVTGCSGSLSGTTYSISSVTANCTVSATFTANPVNYTVTATAGTGGQVSPATQQVAGGNSASVTITPNSGYSIASVSGCGGSLSGSTYYIAAVTSNCTVNASFSATPVNYTVTATAGTGGQVSPATQQVRSGQGATVQVTANSGYTIAAVNGCSGSLSGSTYVIPAVTSNCTVNATFTASVVNYTVTAVAGTGGQVSPSSQQVKSGQGATVQVTPNSGYKISAVSGCGGSLSGSTYVISAVNSNCTVNATFVANVTEYTVTATAGTGGQVSPATQKVNGGAGTTVQVTPNSNYKIASVSGCGGSLSGSTYIIPSVTSNCTVNATFVQNTVPTYTVTATVSGSGGTVSPTTSQVTAGNAATITVTPNSGYTIAAVSGCGGSLNGSNYVISSVNSNCTVTATFSQVIVNHTVNAVAGFGGQISPATQTVANGASAFLTVTPMGDYTIGSVTGCGGSLTGSTYYIPSVTSNCTVTASFNPPGVVTYKVDLTYGQGGSVDITPSANITPISVVANSGSWNVVKGADVKFTIVADTDYKIDQVNGTCGTFNKDVDVENFTISSINSNCQLSVSFVYTGGGPDDIDLGGSSTPAMVIFGLALVALRRRRSMR